MRACLALLAVASSGASRPGRVVRVEQPARREVSIPAGTFTMGIDKTTAVEVAAECEAAYPTTRFNGTGSNLGILCDKYLLAMQHMAPRQVFTSAYFIDRDEVSVADYRACINAGECDLDATLAGDDRYVQDGGAMVNVTWYEAQHYCRWRGGRLPTEAEWERAARGDTSGPWPWGATPRPDDFNHGQSLPTIAHELDRSLSTQGIWDMQGEADASDGAELVAGPGTYPWGDSPYGTRDQAGNVAEWTADAYLQPSGPSADEAPQGYDGLSDADPVRRGSPSDARIVRGGSWKQPQFLARVDVRDPMLELNQFSGSWYAPGARFSHVGFRCVRSNT